jgi:hypothetical protein
VKSLGKSCAIHFVSSLSLGTACSLVNNETKQKRFFNWTLMFPRKKALVNAPAGGNFRSPVILTCVPGAAQEILQAYLS